MWNFGLSIALIIVIIAICLIPVVFFCINLQQTISVCSEKNQKMSPSLVWLLFIPFFSYYWAFHIVIKIRDSLRDEYASRGFDETEVKDCYNIGLAWAICTAACIIPFVNIIAGIGSLVMMIIYWVQTHKIKRKLSS